MSPLSSRRISRLTESDIDRLMAHTSNDRSLQDLHDVVMIVNHTGARLIEVLRLRWSDIDMERRRFILVSKRRRTRLVPFGFRTLAMLEARRERQPNANCVFEASAALAPKLSAHLRKVCSKLDIADGTFRTLRHTFAWRLATSGECGALYYMLGGRSPFKSLISPEAKFELAARDQAKLEDALSGGPEK